MNKAHCSRYVSYQSWRLYTLHRLFLSTKDLDHLGYRSFSNVSELLFLRPQQRRLGLATQADSAGERRLGSRQKTANISSSSDNLHTHDAGSSVSNYEQNNPKSNATSSTSQGPVPNPSRSTNRQEHSKSTSFSPLSRPLPQSPFLNPGNEDIQPVKQRKRQATKEDKDRLRHNPWAMALASNVRSCAATSTRLPTEFLMDWGLVRHPEANNLWFTPKSLFVDELMKASTRDEETEISVEEAEDSDGMSNSQPPKQSHSPHPMKDIRSVTQSPKFYVLNRSVVQKDLTAPATSMMQDVSRLIPFRWKFPMGKLTTGDMRSLVWREDMPEFVLRGLQKEAVKALKKACLKGKVEDPGGVWRVVGIDGDVVDEKGLSVGLERIGELERMGSGGVLVFGSEVMREGSTGGESSIQSASVSSLPDLITLPVQGSQVPVFDLRALLSQRDIDELRQHSPRFQETALFFRPGGNIPVDAMLALWKLKGYAMHDRNI